ncbi:hypothetical protein FV242_25560 [Methylobacterium sp. WL64]|nr:hypothetical protein FV242_25560 [Methylobacterium sp. WL64]
MLAVTTCGAVGQNQPFPSLQNAQCRGEARDKIFNTPNPKRLSPFLLGAEIYHACMRRLSAKSKSPRE